MEAFLKKVALHILEHHRQQLIKLVVVVPNRRASLFLAKYLSEITDIPIWSPRFYSIEDFVFKWSGYQLPPLVDLLFELYGVHRKIEGSKSQSFDRFNSWGQLLLKDFNDLDLYLKDADYLFRYLSETKTISKWSLNPDDLTQMERDYLRFYASLGDYYKELRKVLEEKNLAYQGMAYRKVAEHLKDLNMDDGPIIFAGFNALTPAEELIFDFFEKRGQATVLWDIDRYYFDDKKQEAGFFLRKQLKDAHKQKISWIVDDLRTDSKNINIYGVSGNVSLAKMAGNILSDLADEKAQKGLKLADETAVVLANEALIIPMLYSLPENIDTFNITMSYPSKLSRVYELIINIIDLYILHISAEGKVDENPRFYHKHLNTVLLHPLIQQHLHSISQSNIADEIVQIIKEHNISFIAQKEFPSQFDIDKDHAAFEFLARFAKKIDKPIVLVVLIRELLQLLFEKSDDEQAQLDREFLFHYINLMNRIEDLLQIHPYINLITTLKKLFISLSSAQGIPFTGEPLMGVQIMGMLETRTLDFENLILLSANEGMLPKSHVYQSFILPDIKRELGLPLPVDNDSVFAYHFYRLIQRAKNIYILYNTQNESMGSGELSRYVQQIEWELQEVNPKINIQHKLYHIPLLAYDYDTSIRFPKDDYAIKRLRKIATGKGFSPSTLNTYKACSLKFYFQRILGMYAQDEVEETLAANTQGTVIHGVLEDFYAQKKGKVISESFLNRIKNEYKNELEKRFQQEFGKGDIYNGQNLLLRKVAERYVELFIENERAQIKEGISCTIIDLELNMTRSLDFNFDGEPLKIKFQGSADRVDRLGDVVRVIDYKTGKVEDSDCRLWSRNIDVWDKMFEDKKDKAFQLMMYAWLYSPMLDSNYKLQAGIIGLKYHSKYFPLSISKESGNDISSSDINRFEKDMQTLITELFDVKTDFTQCEDEKNCMFCDYKFICGR